MRLPKYWGGKVSLPFPPPPRTNATDHNPTCFIVSAWEVSLPLSYTLIVVITTYLLTYWLRSSVCLYILVCLLVTIRTRSSSEDEIANVNHFYDDIVQYSRIIVFTVNRKPSITSTRTHERYRRQTDERRHNYSEAANVITWVHVGWKTSDRIFMYQYDK